jgi:hypothetical protein
MQRLAVPGGSWRIGYSPIRTRGRHVSVKGIRHCVNIPYIDPVSLCDGVKQSVLHAESVYGILRYDHLTLCARSISVVSNDILKED